MTTDDDSRTAEATDQPADCCAPGRAAFLRPAAERPADAPSS